MAAGIYLSIPFCRQKCTYCNFASDVHPVSSLPSYLAALEREITQCAERWKRAGLPFAEDVSADSIYLGGGTPGLLDGAQLAALFRTIAERFPLQHGTEITIEASPENATAERAAEWAIAGVNRVSMGVQSMVTRELRAVARQHDAATVAEACANLRLAGITNLGVDLIAGLPHQTAESWSATLDAVIALEVPHISVYMLEVDEDSRLGGELLRSGTRYGAAAVPAEERIVEFYETAMERLGDAGYAHYEISNFARPGRESRHNEKYWTGAPYFGFGVDAHSYHGGCRWANTDSLDAYLERISHGEAALCEQRVLSQRDKLEESFFLGMRRREGVRWQELTSAQAAAEPWAARLQQFIDAGWIEKNAERIRLTDQGVLFSNEVFAGFLDI